MVNKKKLNSETVGQKSGRTFSSRNRPATEQQPTDGLDTVATTSQNALPSSSMGKTSNSPDCRRGLPQVRSSGRIIKRPKRDLTPPPSPPKKVKEKTPEVKPGGRRPGEQWSSHETNIFYQALLEHGRDFDAIHQYFTLKYKKVPERCKTKEQIRYYFYRSCKRIAKYIHLNEDVNKQVAEVYSLINFGEFRKKGLTKLDERTGQKFNALVHKGTTVVRIKGKNIRFKTPACKALLKINQIEDNKDVEKHRQVKLPTHVTLELYPKNSAAWSEVQRISQNPRLRLKVKPDRRLCCVFDFLNQKWKSQRQRSKEKLDGVEEQSSQKFYLYTTPDVAFSYYDIKAPLQLKRDVSMDFYIEHLKSTGGQSNSPISQRGTKRKARSHSTAQEAPVEETRSSVCELSASLIDGEEAQSADMAAAFLANNLAADDTKHLLTDAEKSSDENLTEGETEETVAEEAVTEGCSTAVTAAGNSSSSNEGKEDCKESNVTSQQQQPAFKDSVYMVYNIKPTKTKVTNQPSISDTTTSNYNTNWRTNQDEKIALLKNGICRKVAEQLLIGDVCLLLGNPAQVRLTYDWLECNPVMDILKLGSMSNLLRRLLHVAAAEYSDIKPENMQPPTPPLTASQGVQVNLPTVRDSASPRNAASSAVGKRRATPSTPKQPNRKKVDPGTPTTPTSSKTEILSPLSCAAAVEVKNKKLIPLAKAPHSPSIPPGPIGDGVFKMPTRLPARTLHQLAPNPNQSTEFDPKSFDFPRRRKFARRPKPLVTQPKLMKKPDGSHHTGSVVHLTLLPTQPVISMPSQDISLKNIVVQPPGVRVPLAACRSENPRPPTITVLDPMHFAMRGKCRRIIPTPIGVVTGDNELNTAAMQPVIEDSAQAAASLQNVMVSTVDVAVVSNGAATAVGASAGPPIVTMATSLQCISTTLTMPATHPLTVSTDTTTQEDSISNFTSLLDNLQSKDSSVCKPPGCKDEPLGSPSSMLDVAMPVVAEVDHSTEKLIDLALENSTQSFSAISGLLEPKHEKELSLPYVASTSTATATSSIGTLSPNQLSPNKSFRSSVPPLGSEYQWLNGEDFNLSNFLDSSQSAKKLTTSTMTAGGAMGLPTLSMLADSSRDSLSSKLDVDSTLHCIMNESSIDYMSKFADLIREVNSTTSEEEKPKSSA